MNAFDQFEIWWVTGAQLLYGGDAVVAVDAHSKDMVDGLNQSGNIPVKIVYKGSIVRISGRYFTCGESAFFGDTSR